MRALSTARVSSSTRSSLRQPKTDQDEVSLRRGTQGERGQHLRDAVALLESKATAAEVDQYRRFVLVLTTKVAAAHKAGRAEREPRRGRGDPGDHSGARNYQFLTRP